MTRGEHTHPYPLLLQPWGRGPNTQITQGTDRCHLLPNPKGPGMTTRLEEGCVAPPSLATFFSPSPPPSWDPPEQFAEEEPPATQAGQVHQGPCIDDRSPPPG